MFNIPNLAMAEEILATYYPKTRPGAYKLDRMKQLMGYLGNPQENYRAIHISGTSGKSSTAYYTAALLTESGHKVGLTVSPHVMTLNERVQINGKPLAEALFCAQLATFLQAVEDSGIQPTYFELIVAFAYSEFARQQVDYAVVEVGLGGLLDGTNVVYRADKICMITDIGYDHTEILGNTLAEISFQKAGIIKHGNHVYLYRQAPEVIEVITKTCRQRKATLHIIDPARRPYSLPDTLPAFQHRNITLAATMIAEQCIKHLGPNAVKEAAHIVVPGRMEVLTSKDQTIILDGSHNAQKVTALVEGIQARYKRQNMQLVVSFAESKQPGVLDALKQLRHLSDKIIITTFSAAQDEIRIALDPELVVAMAQEVGFMELKVIPEPEKAFGAALLAAPIVIVTGTNFLYDHIRPLI